CCLAAQAHVGSPNVFFEGKAGEYAVHVVIRPPKVVPGLAEISVRVPGEPVQHVTVLPVFWSAGRKGAPPPDEARLVRGESNLYSAALWFMKSGAYSVDVNIQGPRGQGTLVIPVNSAATNTRPMPMAYRVILCALAIVLFVGALKIAGAAFSESRLDPEGLPTKKDRWRGRAAMIVTAGVLSLMLFGGKKWWDFEERNYRNNSLYKPVPVAAQVRTEREQHILQMRVNASERRGQWTPLIPDHGKLMHLFLIGTEAPSAFAHLHPVRRSEAEFEAPLPPLPAGSYSLYADVTHENGFSETLTASVVVPPASTAMKTLWLGTATEPICSAATAQMLATNLFFPPDLDDAGQIGELNNLSELNGGNDEQFSRQRQRICNIASGYRMIWENPGPLVENGDALLRFKLVRADNRPVLIEPYLGMPGHAVVWRQDGAVFAHVHPEGTFSMAAR